MEYRSLYLPDLIRWDEESITERYGKLVITPLERGFGRTIGNALRRVMLSSLEGAAPVSMRIRGVEHEFSSIPGVIQDVPDIVLNIKLLNIRYDGDGTGVLKLKATKPGIVTGADMKGSDDISVSNPDQVIAELSDKTDLDLELSVERGKGYITSDEWREMGRGSEPGLILIDSWFGPVRKVNYTVESARVGDRTDFDRLIMEVVTDGSVSPQESIESACGILLKHFQMILEGKAEAAEPGAEGEGAADQGFQDRSLRDTELSPRLVNCMAAGGIDSLLDLASRTPGDLLRLRNFGQASLRTVEDLLAGYGLSLSADEE